MLVTTVKPTKKKHLALVGKGVTYDAGGLHLQGRGAMETMKADTGGAAAALGAFLALVRLHKKHKLTLAMCRAENAGRCSWTPARSCSVRPGWRRRRSPCRFPTTAPPSASR